jgi:hypothetical protein
MLETWSFASNDIECFDAQGSNEIFPLLLEWFNFPQVAMQTEVCCTPTLAPVTLIHDHWLRLHPHVSRRGRALCSLQDKVNMSSTNPQSKQLLGQVLQLMYTMCDHSGEAATLLVQAGAIPFLQVPILQHPFCFASFPQTKRRLPLLPAPLVTAARPPTQAFKSDAPVDILPMV